MLTKYQNLWTFPHATQKQTLEKGNQGPPNGKEKVYLITVIPSSIPTCWHPTPNQNDKVTRIKRCNRTFVSKLTETDRMKEK